MEQQQQQETETLTPEQIEYLKQEREALKQILNKGLGFDVPKLITGFLFRGKNKLRTLVIKKPYLSTMDALADIYLQMRLNEVAINSDYKRERHLLVKMNNKLACLAIATMYLNRTWKIKLFAHLLAGYLNKRLDSEKLHQVSRILEFMGDYGNFIDSIRSMAGTDRISAPKADQIEAK